MFGPRIKSYWMTFAFALVSMILAIVAVAASWVYASVDGYSVNLYITGTACSSYNNACASIPNIPGGFVAAEALIVVGLVFAILGATFSLLGALGITIKGLQARLLFLFGGLAIPLTLAAPFVFLGTSYAGGSPFVNSTGGVIGMFGSPYSAGAGWYCAIVAGVFLLITWLMFIRKSNAEQKAAVMAGATYGSTGAPAYGAPMQPQAAPMGYGAPAAAAPMAPAPMAAPASPPICPKCGKPTTYIAQYQRYYCYTDQLYV